MYKACGPMGFCSMSGIAAAVDAAVKDGVDILTKTSTRNPCLHRLV
jgi:hypothetical protein